MEKQVTPTSSPVNAEPVQTTGTSTSARSRDGKDAHPDNTELPGLAQFVALLLGLTATPAASTKSPSTGTQSPPGDASRASGTPVPPGGNGLPLDSPESPKLSPVSRPIPAAETIGKGNLDMAQLATAAKANAQQIADVLKMAEQLQKAVTTSRTDALPTTPAVGSPAPALPPFANSTSATAAPPQAPGAPVPTDPQGMAAGVAGRVQWMMGNQQPLARINVSPAHLGPIEVSVQVDEGGKARIAFTAHHEAASEALQAATPRLREMLGQSGINLVQVSIGQQDAGARQQPRDRQHDRNPERAGPAPVDGIQAARAIPRPVAVAEGMVDDYA